jgi:hypothetical protein
MTNTRGEFVSDFYFHILAYEIIGFITTSAIF